MSCCVVCSELAMQESHNSKYHMYHMYHKIPSRVAKRAARVNKIDPDYVRAVDQATRVSLFTDMYLYPYSSCGIYSVTLDSLHMKSWKICSVWVSCFINLSF